MPPLEGGASRKEKFSTPSSWELPAAQDPMTQGKRGQGAGLQTEGEMPQDGDQEGGGRALEEDSLERSLEKEMMNQLHLENLQLKETLECLLREKRHSSAGPSWSEVSAAMPRSRSPMPRPPKEITRRKERRFHGDHLRMMALTLNLHQ